MSEGEELVLNRDCDAVLIPAGDRVVLKAGEPVTITQALGGSFTVYIHGNLARIDARNADALGKETENQPAGPANTGVVDQEEIWAQLRTCYDPEIPVNIVDLGLIYDLQIVPLPTGGNRVEVKMTLTAPGCGMGPVLQRDVEEKLLSIPGVSEVAVLLVWDPPWNREMISEAARLELGLM